MSRISTRLVGGRYRRFDGGLGARHSSRISTGQFRWQGRHVSCFARGSVGR
jgi:hypothetical protein